jgi:4-hydroxy-tetrahydrodipicolinate synthase
VKNNTEWLRGCATALVTPFNHDGAIDEDCLRALIERQIAGGVKLLVPCGTTGESATMATEEDQRVIRVTVEMAQGRAKVIAGASNNNTRFAIRNARNAALLGADAVMFAAPYYNKPTQAGLYAHYRAIAEALPDVAIVIYNVPGRTAVNVKAETTLRLAHDCANIVAVKEASGDVSQIMDILRERPAGFRVLSGDDALTLALIALGADGLVSVISNETPDLTSQMVNACLSNDWDKARELHYRLLPLMDANFIETSPGPVKAVMKMQGLLEENLRLPLVAVEETTREKLREIASELGLLE